MTAASMVHVIKVVLHITFTRLRCNANHKVFTGTNSIHCNIYVKCLTTSIYPNG